MKYVKMLGLLAIAAAALMAFAGSASATEITSSTGSTPTILAASSNAKLTTNIATITCDNSTVEGTVSAHGSGITASGSISKLTFTECTGNDAEVLTNGTGTKGTGTLEVHKDEKAGAATGDGTLTSNGTRVTVRFTAIGVNCIFETQNTDIGTVTGAEHAILTINSAPITRVAGDSGVFCGSEPGIWTGSYTVIHPTDLTIH